MSDRELHRIQAQVLYDPGQEHDACGVGFVADKEQGTTSDEDL